VDVGDDANLREVATRSGLDAAAIVRAADDAEFQQRVMVGMGNALQAGIFGVPFFVYRGENFWGNEYHSNFTNLFFPGIAVWFGIPFLVTGFRRMGRVERMQVICIVACCVFCFLCAFNYVGVRPLLKLPVLRSMWLRWFAGGAVFAAWPVVYAAAFSGFVCLYDSIRRFF